MSVLLIVPLWKTHEKAGQNPALSLIVIIPFFGFLICLAILAFSNWKTGKKLLEEQ
jgi:hypothetical protein